MESSDSARRIRRQELLGVARRQRHDFLDSCRERDEKSARYRALRRECEYAILDESCAGRFDSGGRVVRFLSELVEDGGSSTGEPLVPLASTDGVERELCTMVETNFYGSERTEDAVDILIERLKHPQAAELVQSVQRFVYGFKRDPDDDDSVDRIEAFATYCGSIVSQRQPPWHSLTEAEVEGSIGAFETIICRRLHSQLFVVDEAGDLELEERLKSLDFLGWEHLDVKPHAAGSISKRVEWYEVLRLLNSINAAKAPSDKVGRLQTATRMLSRLIAEPNPDSDSDDGPPGADDLLPALIMAVKAARPARLLSNVLYLEKNAKRLTGEQRYLVVKLSATMAFLTDLEAEQIQMSPADFDRCIRASEERLKMQERIIASSSEQQYHHADVTKMTPQRELTARELRATRLAEASTQAARLLLEDQPYYHPVKEEVHHHRPGRRFLGANPDFLTPAAVRELLADYHTLAAQLDAAELSSKKLQHT